jgi:methylglyoxal synthase
MEPVGRRKRIGIVAHDNKKRDLIEWARYNRLLLEGHDLVATGTTGTLLEDALGAGVKKLQPGPLGGDQQARGPRPIMISSPLMTSDYVRTVPDNGDYLNRSFE